MSSFQIRWQILHHILTYLLPGVRKYASMMRLLDEHICSDIVSQLADIWYQNVLWNLSEKASHCHKRTLRQLSWNPGLNVVHYSMQQLLVVVELQKIKLSIFLLAGLQVMMSGIYRSVYKINTQRLRQQTRGQVLSTPRNNSRRRRFYSLLRFQHCIIGMWQGML